MDAAEIIVIATGAVATTSIEFTPDRAGEFTFTCGMSMLRGRLIVQ